MFLFFPLARSCLFACSYVCMFLIVSLCVCLIVGLLLWLGPGWFGLVLISCLLACFVDRPGSILSDMFHDKFNF